MSPKYYAHNTLLNKLGHLSVTLVLLNPSVCSSCQLLKSKRLSFHKCATIVLDLILCDLRGPAPIIISDGFWYYVAFVDDYSQFSWIYPLHAKSEFLRHWFDFISLSTINLYKQSNYFRVMGD